MLRRMGQYCGYDINYPKNSVVLPATEEAVCYLEKPLHNGPHDWGSRTGKPYNYTNQCAALTHRIIRSEIKDRMRNGSCGKTTNSTLMSKFNESSNEILTFLSNFIWPLSQQGMNFNPGSKPYFGCQNSGDGMPCKAPSKHVLLQLISKTQIVNYDLKIGQ
ncbi:AHH domain-containing protein [Shewanella algae]|uniref:Uncharacterized protein n=2 Tax=Shewanella algae TaxID=38313 RepID=A0A7T8EDJ5_9GAMM|nr:hypothetical protein D7032_15030 [Shewanella algae]